MINLKNNANTTLNAIIYSPSTFQFFINAQYNYKKRYEQPFITTLQILITKIGVAISIVDKTDRNVNYFLESLEYLCKTVIVDNSLYDKLNINTKGNYGKHSVKNNKILIDELASNYNHLLQSIKEKYKLTTLDDIMLKLETNNINKVSYTSNNKSIAICHSNIIKSQSKKEHSQKIKIIDLAKILKTDPDELICFLSNIIFTEKITEDYEVSKDMEKKLAKMYGVPYPFKAVKPKPATNNINKVSYTSNNKSIAICHSNTIKSQSKKEHSQKIKIIDLAKILKTDADELICTLSLMYMTENFTAESKIPVDIQKRLAKMYGVPYPFKKIKHAV